MKERMSSISDSTIKTLKIHEFIYHIMIQGTSLPEYLEEVKLSRSQEAFFTSMIKECTKGTQYKFEDSEKSLVPLACKDIVLDPAKHFKDKSEEIAEHFLVSHPNTASSGVLIISRITMEVDTETKSFIAIIKVDYTKVLQQVRDPKNKGRVSFKEIVDSLAEDKQAIQKRALIDINEIYNWDVLAVERNRTGQKLDSDKAITEYFRIFLAVNLLQNDSVYSKKVPGAVAKWASTVEDLNRSEARAKAVSLIQAKDGQSITMDDIADTVCAHVDEKIFNERKKSFNKYMSREDTQLNGVQFVARPNSISPKDKVTRYQTNNKVTVTFEGSPEENGVVIEHDKSTGGKIIKIYAEIVNDIS